MRRIKQVLAILGLGALVIANAFAYGKVRALVLAYHDIHVPPYYPVLTWLAVAFAGTAILGFGTALFAANTFSPKKQLSWIVLCAASAVLFFSACASVPISSVDNSWNVLSARNLVVHGSNPYVTPAGAFPEDPAYVAKWSRWYGLPMVYGPLWTALSAIPIILVSGVQEQTKGMLLLNIAGYMLAGSMLYRWLRRRSAKKAWYVIAFWLLNPVAALEIANAGHNEGVMLPFIVLLATSLVDENLTLAAVGIIGAALIKHWPLALAPALLAIPATNRKRLTTIAVSITALVIAWLPFWAGKDTLSGIRSMATFGNEGFFLSPFRLAAWYAFARLHVPAAEAAMRALAAATSLVTLLVVTVSAFRRKISPVIAALLLLATYHFVWLSWLQPWYLLTFIPFIAVSMRKDEAVLIMAAFGVTGMLSYQFGPSLTTGVALLFLITVAVLHSWQKKRLGNSATKAPRTDPSE